MAQSPNGGLHPLAAAVALVLLLPSTVAASGTERQFAVGSAAGVVINWQPTWSPDGKWIAYASNRDGSGFDIWKTDGVHVRRVVHGGDEPAWAPDGRQIAFVALDATRASTGIYLAAPSGTASPRAVLREPAFSPSWSPDTRKIAFGDVSGGFGFGISVVHGDGSHRTRLVTSEDEQTDSITPAWSPTGTQIAYAAPGSRAIGIVNADGTPSLPVPVKLDSPTHPSWSPDGRRIVFVTPLRYTGTPAAEFGPMFVVDVRTNRVRRLTRLLANGPAWSPAGKRIAFTVRAPDGSGDIYLVNPDGSHLLRLTKTLA